MIQSYGDFITELLQAGFSMASGGNNEGIFGLLPHGWNDEPTPSPIGETESAIRWHTGDPEHDPWTWRMRVLEERCDIAYSKVFFQKAGYITKEWYPYFLAARRSQSFADAYSDGLMSRYAKEVYEHLREYGPAPAHELKFSKEEKSKYEKAAVELQMGLHITMCGQRQKTSRRGENYGWSSNLFCTVEQFWPEEVFAKAVELLPQEAERAITARVLELNPAADGKRIKKFIYGNTKA